LGGFFQGAKEIFCRVDYTEKLKERVQNESNKNIYNSRVFHNVNIYLRANEAQSIKKGNRL
jgi:hypothetical protein